MPCQLDKAIEHAESNENAKQRRAKGGFNLELASPNERTIRLMIQDCLNGCDYPVPNNFMELPFDSVKWHEIKAVLERCKLDGNIRQTARTGIAKKI